MSADPIEQRRTSVPVPRTMRHASLFPHTSAVHQDAMGADDPATRLLIFPLHRRAHVWRHTRCQGRGRWISLDTTTEAEQISVGIPRGEVGTS